MTKGKRIFKTLKAAQNHCQRAIRFGHKSHINIVGSHTFVVEVE